MNEMLPVEIIENKIFVIRGIKVMLDRDLAELYGVKTMVLNQAVKRNIKRFPDDFMFKLNDNEFKELITNCDRFKVLKHSPSTPYAFTEQGVAMLSSVLNSKIEFKKTTRNKSSILKNKNLSYFPPRPLRERGDFQNEQKSAF